ncbi:MAG TPA: class II aldolase/adducin family protein [Candidatus Hydrogenedentes bacterium]|nr:class II aldolase/adducin family protein [Candidatus Hydrogenedentota bacterium]
MRVEFLHPCDQVAMIMDRVYAYGMTTTSGGNVSMRDDSGDIWITPAKLDKGRLKPESVVHMRSGKATRSDVAPSSEYPFHEAIYKVRPDIKAVLHAHPSALVAFSIVKNVPDTHIIPQAAYVCGKVGFAPYAVPGSSQLGENIAAAFEEGYNCVLLENHGVVCAGNNLLEAYHRFETLDFCARLIIRASTLGACNSLTDEQLALFHHNRHFLPIFRPQQRSNRERKLRKFICEIVHRAYDQNLMTSTEGVLSARLDGNSFLITPTGVDRHYVDVADIVLVRDGHREEDKVPSRSVLLHKAIYDRHPHVMAIISAQAPNSTAFAVTDAELNSRCIPESYLVLRDIPRAPYGIQFGSGDEVAEYLSPERPVVLLQNDAVLATGSSLLEAYDRLEVAEFTANALLNAIPLGGLVPMDDARIEELLRFFS